MAISDVILQNLHRLPDHQKMELLKMMGALEDARQREAAQADLLAFIKHMWPTFISGRHFEIMADAFRRVAEGKLKRLMIHMPPRHGKSETTSYFFPAWFLGKHPGKKVIMASNTAELAVGFGRRVRNLVASDEYQKIFPDVSLKEDSKSAGRWSTNKGGEYFAVGVGGTMTGRGADILVIDDPHSEGEAVSAITNPAVYDRAYEWYTSGPFQRLQPGGAVVIVATRWSQRDLPARIIKDYAERGKDSEWEVIEFPAIFTPDLLREDERHLYPDGKPLWPEFWTIEELLEKKDGLTPSKWNAQYQQNPTSEEGALIKREWWREWKGRKAPELEAIMVSWDTAYLKTERADYSACTTWGIFNHPNAEGRSVPHLILLDAFRDKLEFPELKKKAMEHYRHWKPDMLIVEAKAAGAPLVYELRAMGIPVQEYTPTRGKRNAPNDKIARVNSITDIFASGMVFYMPSFDAEMVMEEIAAFPFAEHDDYVDSTTQALMRFRQGGFVGLASDEEDEDEPRRRVEYY